MSDKNQTRTPGEYIREELEARNWTQTDLAKITGRPLPTINGIIQGKHAILPDMAVALGEAFGNGAEVWMNREASYKLSQATEDGELVRKRARLYQLVPIKDLQRRGWIRETDDVERLEEELLRFFGVQSLLEDPEIIVAFKKTNPDQALTPAQRAWCFRAHALASAQVVSRFDEGKLDECVEKLRKLAAFAPEIRKVSKVLAGYGIRFIVIEPLPGTKVDGAAFWVDEDKPAIAVSCRHDRIDAFWFTLFHEFSHVRHKDTASIDLDLVGEDATPSIAKSAIERRADKEAANTLIPADKMESFIHRVAPLYSKDRIIQFAHRAKIHPGIIVGQLQHRGEIGFYANREMLVKVRDVVISSAMVDGWGNSIS